MKFQIDNEYGKLEAVLVHRPGREIDRLMHDNMRQFLFEDIPFLRRMQEEHDAFVGKMHEQDVEVVYLENLLADILGNDITRAAVLRTVCQNAGVPAIADEMTSLDHWDKTELTDLLFAGLNSEEYTERIGRRIPSPQNEPQYLLPPIPNAYFSRDPAVVVRDVAISSKMHHRVRVRESVLTRAVLENHPEFKTNTIVYGGTDEPTEDRPYTIEGGDVIILSPDAVLVGASERTRSETIEMLAGKCFSQGQVKRVYEVPIPTERSFMHLDTVFTVVDRGMIVWYAEVMQQVKYIHRYESDGGDEGGVNRVPEDRSFVDILRDEFGTDVTLIDTAGGTGQFAAREQRTDGTNTLAIAPRVAITYERNERTTAALEEHGVTCIGIDDSELVRGLGGPRCMTMPLRRAPA